MNEAHFHLLVNHLPFFFPLIASIVLVFGWSFKHSFTQRVAFLLFTIGAVCTFFAMSSGEEAEEIVEGLGISHTYIHEHEERAEFFALFNYLVGCLSLLAIWLSWKQHKLVASIRLITLAFGIVVVYLSVGVGSSGGEIVHKEIRKGFVPQESDDHIEEGD